jgi:hypothetical protein
MYLFVESTFGAGPLCKKSVTDTPESEHLGLMRISFFKTHICHLNEARVLIHASFHIQQCHRLNYTYQKRKEKTLIIIYIYINLSLSQ